MTDRVLFPDMPISQLAGIVIPLTFVVPVHYKLVHAMDRR